MLKFIKSEIVFSSVLVAPLLHVVNCPLRCHALHQEQVHLWCGNDDDNDDVASGAPSHAIDMPTFDGDYNLTEETVGTQDQENEKYSVIKLLTITLK